jgi:hypothetical protein
MFSKEAIEKENMEKNAGEYQLILVSKKRLDGQYDFDIQERPKKNLNSDVRCMIRMNDPKKTIWELFVIILAIYNAFFIPVEIAFTPPELKEAFWTFVNTLVDCVFLADIFVQFRTTHYDIDTGDECYDAKVIARKYLSSRFTIDLLSTLPIDNIAKIFSDTNNPALQLFSLLKLVRVSKISHIIEKMNVMMHTK